MFVLGSCSTYSLHINHSDQDSLTKTFFKPQYFGLDLRLAWTKTAIPIWSVQNADCRMGTKCWLEDTVCLMTSAYPTSRPHNLFSNNFSSSIAGTWGTLEDIVHKLINLSAPHFKVKVSGAIQESWLLNYHPNWRKTGKNLENQKPNTKSCKISKLKWTIWSSLVWSRFCWCHIVHITPGHIRLFKVISEITQGQFRSF